MQRPKSQVAAWLHAVIAISGPVSPTNWWPLAHTLSRTLGWMPSMLLIALFGTTMFLNGVLEQFVNGPIGSVIGVATWFTWGVISCLAMSIGCIEGGWDLRRLGFRSASRPRMWFELSRLSWHGLFLGFTAITTTASIAGVIPIGLGVMATLSATRIVVELLSIVFLCTGAIAYLLAFVRWRMPTGRAFECVNFFLPTWIGGGLFLDALDQWPRVAMGPAAIMAAMAGLLGVVILGVSFAVTVHRMDQWEKRIDKRRVTG